MKFTARHIPGYQRLRKMVAGLPILDPEGVDATATVHAVGSELDSALRQSLAKQGVSESRLRVPRALCGASIAKREG